jgi:hypothetical protein
MVSKLLAAKPHVTVNIPRVLQYGLLGIFVVIIVGLPLSDKPIQHPINVSIPDQADWIDYGSIIEAGNLGEWDYQLWGGFAGTAVKRNGTYYLYYQGASDYQLEPDETVTWRAIGVATSSDGVNFTKSVQNPIINWFPTPDGEEGTVSGGIALDGSNNFTMIYGANTAVGPTVVNADGRLTTSTNGIFFIDQGIVLDHQDSEIWGSGDELFPIIAFQDNSQWFVYYIPNGNLNARKLGVAWGNSLNNLNNSDQVSSGGSITAWGMGGYAEVGDDVYALFINDLTVPKIEVRTVSLDSPNQASAAIETYQFEGVTNATVLLDDETNTWFMFYQRTDDYGLRLAPAGSPDTTPPTAPNNVLALPLNDRQIKLSWNPATDTETGIVLYNIFRDGVQVGTVKGLNYTDTGLNEQTAYSYRISAVNYHGVEGPKSTPIVATTPADITPPQIVSVNSNANDNQVTIVFNETVEKANATNVTDYYAINNVTVLSATLAADLRTVTLLTTNQTDDNYLLTVHGLNDRAATPNPIEPPILKNYIHTGINGLIGSWSFNEGVCATSGGSAAGSLIDTSNFGNNGRVFGQPATTTGYIGQALNFDGFDDHITIEGLNVLENVTHSNHTFAAWVYPDSTPPATTPNNNAYTILSRAYTGLYYDADRTFRAEIHLTDDTQVSVSSGVFNPGTWHHVIMTIDDVQNKLHLYVDGQEVNNSPVSFNGTLADHEDAPYFVGTSDPLENRYEYRFNGIIDETRIFNRNLSSNEVDTLYSWLPNNPIVLLHCNHLPVILR